MEINALDQNARLGDLIEMCLDEMRGEYIILRRKAAKLDRGNPLKISKKTKAAFQEAAEALKYYFIATDLREAMDCGEVGYAKRAERNAIMGKLSPLYLVEDEKTEAHDNMIGSYEEKHGV